MICLTNLSKNLMELGTTVVKPFYSNLKHFVILVSTTISYSTFHRRLFETEYRNSLNYNAYMHK